MSEEKFIHASCKISNHIVFKNGKVVFENKQADVAGFLLSVYTHFTTGYAKFYKMDNLCKLGWLSSEILLHESFEPEKYRPEETGLVFANANASLDTDLKYFETTKDIASPSVFVYTLPNIMMGEICIKNNFKGENAFFVSEEFDAGFMEKYVSNLLDNKIVKACICGWVDLLVEDYKAVLFLVEKDKGGQSILFTEENMNKIFQANDV